MRILLRTHRITIGQIKALKTLETIYTVRLTDKKAFGSMKKTIPLAKEQEEIHKSLKSVVMKTGVNSGNLYYEY